MINLSTPKDQMLAEMLSDEKKARYWFRKQYHGDRGYGRMQDELIEKARASGKDEISEIHEYISPNGNRWMMFEVARHYRKAHTIRTMPHYFCYYETFGSVRAFMTGYDQMDTRQQRPVLLIFTSHFFQRFCERLDLKMRSRWMVQKFCEVIPGYILYPYKEKDPHNGLYPVDIRLPKSLGRGFIVGHNVVEIRSFIRDDQLTKKQLKETEEVRRLGDELEYEPLDVWARRLRYMSTEESNREIEKKFEFMIKQGIPQEVLEVHFLFTCFTAQYLTDNGYIDPVDFDEGDLRRTVEDLGFALTDSVESYYKDKSKWPDVWKAYAEYMKRKFKVDYNDLFAAFDDFMKCFGEEKEKAL